MRAWVIAGLLGLVLAGSADAGLEICNNTEQMQSVAIGYKGDTDWTSEGWWNIEPGKCSVLVGGDLTKRYYYYYADSAGGGFRGQDYGFCTQKAEFTIIGDTDCDARGYVRTEFREIDTGETATAFTLTLVETTPPGGGLGAKGPGGGEEDGADVAMQTMTESPEVPVIAIDEAALTTNQPAGRHGKPFEVDALFQGCELEDGRAYCGFHADGVKLRAYYKGPTDTELMYTLEDMDLNAPVTIVGDEADRSRLHAAVVLREVRPRRDDDAMMHLRRTLQGDWVSVQDPKSEITIRGSEMYVRYDGVFRLTRFLRLARRCDGLRGEGPVLFQTSLRDRQPKCYRVVKADGRSLQLDPVAGGAAMQFRKLR
ncbi:MAG: DUF1036 domain-containing protein [Rhodobacter sp.]|nr:DUF1036 domain-containing protein [Rhodobacter sp.]